MHSISESSGCSAARLARQLRELEVPGSNPGTPTQNAYQHHVDRLFCIIHNSECTIHNYYRIFTHFSHKTQPSHATPRTSVFRGAIHCELHRPRVPRNSNALQSTTFCIRGLGSEQTPTFPFHPSFYLGLVSQKKGVEAQAGGDTAVRRARARAVKSIYPRNPVSKFDIAWRTPNGIG